ncbi:integrase core domain-containing protein [Glaesserella parasuis]|nr:integrase core domain-containing protein [Glaesserella parasuis]
MLFHSDQGSIYGSKQFTQCMQNYKLTQSMSRRGNCWDNAPMERWFRSFKYEWMTYGGYVDFESAVNDVKDYVMYYNHIRPHSYNQGLPPILAEKTYRGLLN